MEDQTTEVNQTLEPKKSPNLMLIGGGILATLVLGVGILSRNTSPTTLPAQTEVEEGNDMENSEKMSEPVGEETNSDTTMEAEVIEVEGGMFYFNPNEIRVKKGDTVKIVLNNVEGMHDFVIDDLDVRTSIIQSGQTAEAEFVADEVGEYEYFCSVANHREMGMTGTLIVEK